MGDLAVIFDMDGVLIDSVALNWRAMNKVLNDNYGVFVADDDLQYYIGKTLHDQISQLNDNYNIKIDYPSFLAATDQLKVDIFADIQPKDGVVSLLKVLREKQLRIGVGTSISRAAAEQRLAAAGILNQFQALVTEEDVDKHKPDPEVYLKAAERLGADPARCVVFEDAPSGIEAAKHAGMKCVAVRTTYVPDEKLATADLVVSSLADFEIRQLLDLLTSKPKK